MYDRNTEALVVYTGCILKIHMNRDLSHAILHSIINL